MSPRPHRTARRRRPRHAAKGIRAAALLAAGALAVTGCGGSSSGGTRAEDGTTTLVWQMWSGTEIETQALQELSRLVTQEHPDLRVEVRTSTFGDYWTRLAAQASGGDVGCLVGVQSPRAPSIDLLLRPITDADLAAAGVSLDDFNPTIVEALRVDGELVALPYDLGPLVVYYNADAFEEAGVPLPTPEWTQDDFDAAARALVAEGRAGFSVAPTVDQVMAWSLARNGVQGVDEDGELALTDPGMVEAVAYLRSLVEEGVAPALPATNDPNVALNQFVAGGAAMVVDGPWQLGFVQGEAAFEAGIAPVPASPGGAGALVAGSGFGISAGCPYPEEALRALAVLTGPDAQQYLAEAGRAYPARTAQQGAWFGGEQGGAQAVLTAALQEASPYRSTERWTQVNTLFTQYSVQAFNGQITAEDLLATVQEQAG